MDWRAGSGAMEGAGTGPCGHQGKGEDMPPRAPTTWGSWRGEGPRPFPTPPVEPGGDSLADFDFDPAPDPRGISVAVGEGVASLPEVEGDDGFVIEVDLGLEEPGPDWEPPSSWAKLTAKVGL